MHPGLGKAESLRDLTASMAETLFGNAEFEAVAAEVAVKRQQDKDAASGPKDAPPADSGPDKDAIAAAAERDPSIRLELVEDTQAGAGPQAQDAADVTGLFGAEFKQSAGFERVRVEEAR